MSILIKNARVLSLDNQLNDYERADIFIRGSKIVSIGQDFQIPQAEPDLRIINASGMLAMPGLVNC